MKEADLDGERFDGLTRAMDHGVTRRVALGVLAGIAGIGLSGVTTKAKDVKVEICHYDAKRDTWVAISVDPGGLVGGHSKHEQDFLRGAGSAGCCNDSECSYLNNERDCLVGVCYHTTGTCRQEFYGDSGCL